MCDGVMVCVDVQPMIEASDDTAANITAASSHGMIRL